MNNNHHKSYIGDVPYELKTLILKYLTPKDKCNMCMVSKEWNNVVNIVNKDADLPLQDRLCVTNSNYESVFSKLQRHADCKQLGFASFTLPFPAHAVIPDCIQTIRFSGQIMNHELLSILDQCQLLKHLDFGDINFTDRILTGDISYVQLPNLLQISVKCVAEKCPLEPKFRRDEEQLLSFLNGLSYGGLRIFKCICSNDILDHLDVSSLFNENAKGLCNLFKFVIKNKATLGKIILGEQENPLVLVPLNSRDGKPLQLVSIKGIYDIPPTYDIMFRIQYNLKSLKLNNALRIFWFTAIAISQSSDSITDIHLAGSGKLKTYDFQVLSTCSNLKHLSLLFSDCLISPFPTLTVKLLSLKLCGPLTENNLLKIISRQVNLEEFLLEDNFPNKNFINVHVAEIDADVVEKFMLQTNVISLSFKRCLIMEWRTLFEWCNEYDNIRMGLYKKAANGNPEGILIERNLFL